jgi:peptide deformylase
VEEFDSALEDMLHEMVLLMRAHRGIGLAAPQVGIVRRFFLCELDGNVVSFVNPEIDKCKGQAELVEGCLSLPGVSVNVSRNRRLRVRAYDPSGRRIRCKLTGLWSRVFQHELDHLDGVLISDHGENLEAGLETHAERST